MRDLNNRIQQLTKLILTSATVDESKGDDSRPASPVKIDFDMSPYQVSFLAIIKKRLNITKLPNLAPTRTPRSTRPTGISSNPNPFSRSVSDRSFPFTFQCFRK